MINGRISLILYMHFMLRIIVVFYLTVSLCSCKNQETVLLKMNGNWKVYVSEGQMQECWMMENANSYNGNCLLMNNLDTLFFETMKIHKKGDRYVYATSFLLNGEEHKTDFYLTKCNNRRLVFENKTHDFPQLISYTFFTPDSMLATIGGMEKDTMRYEYLPMKKIISK
jgi:hypothetical protein